jgi:tRNA 2-thiocytidine biosynthesis protein TtcA
MNNVRRQLYRQLKQTSEKYALLAPGDHVLVALSGGKDSYTLLVLLDQLVRRLPFSIRLTAVHLDQRQPGYDGEPLARWLAESGLAYEILSEDTYSVVTEHLSPGATYCSLCSRLRRGILYTAAERLGCNKLALGHHRDDSLETFLMNLLYSGKLQAMPAKYRTDDGRFEVIRPLIQCAEDSIRAFAAEARFPILPCNLCGSQPGLKRDRMAQLLDELDSQIPNVRSIMMAALANVSPTHLLDPKLASAHPSTVAPAPSEREQHHHKALPITAFHPDPSKRRRQLPILRDQV